MNQLIVEDVRDTQYAESNLQDTNYTKYFYYDSRGNITDTKTYLYGQNESMATDSPYSFRQENFDQEWIEVRYNSSYFYDDIYDLNIGQNPTLNFEFSLWQEQGPYFYLPAYIYYDNLDIYTEGFYKRSYYVMEQGIWYEFDIIFKVGNPTELVTPQDHIHYNYSSYWKDQLSSIDTITYLQDGSINTTTRSYSYDGQGNSTNISNFYFEGVVYDHAVLSYDGRQLAKIEIYSSPAQLAHTIVYTYNDQGYRTSKTIDSQTIDYFLHGDKVLYETDGIYGIIYTYDYDGSLISFNYDNNVNDTTPGTEYFYVRNQQGDITKVIDHTGNIIVEYVYDAWGNIVNWDEISSIIIAQINPYTYRGYRYDKETNLYYLNSRYYDANIGRFINADGLLGSMGDSQSTNMYAYCANNPVMYSDISGYIPLPVITAGTGAILGAIFGAYRAYQNGDNIWGGVLNGALVGGAVGLAMGLGIVNLGPVLAGTSTASTSAAISSFSISTAVSFVSGAIGYASEEFINYRSPSLKNMLGHGTVVTFESVIAFGFGGIMGRVGKIGDLNFISREWVLKQLFLQEFIIPFRYTLDSLRYQFFD